MTVQRALTTILAVTLIGWSAHVVAKGTYHCQPAQFIVANNHHIPFKIEGHQDNGIQSDGSERIVEATLEPKIIYMNNVCGRYVMTVSNGNETKRYHLLVDYNQSQPADTVSININSDSTISYNKQVVKIGNLDDYLAWHGPENIMQHRQLY